MPSDLAQLIDRQPLADTHEHLAKEADWVANPPDILLDLFSNYVPADFISAGAPPAAVQALCDPANPDVAARFSAVRSAWDVIQFTGYGEAVRLVAHEFYGLDQLTPGALEGKQETAAALRRPGERLRLLRQVAGLDHTQTDDFVWPCPIDESGPDFFFYDLSWFSFCDGSFDPAQVTTETGVEVRDTGSLREAMARIFAMHAPTAIAVKAQHAYSRTLRWAEQDEADVERLLQRKLHGEPLSRAELDVIGDWCWARGVELSIEHHLPFKIHTGYYAGNDRMPVEYISAENLCPLLARYLDARFVLMHASYPYSTALVALAKHYRNVWADCCWAWSMNPLQMVRFVREFIHAAPVNKLFAFGGDTFTPTAAAAYSRQARRWLARALEEEVRDGDLSEAEAMGIAQRIMLQNQLECFDLAAKRAAMG